LSGCSHGQGVARSRTRFCGITDFLLKIRGI
jgi:hypothetical protein